MDFPKKQAQRLMPLYLLEYSEKLFENHPDPEAPWGGGGGSDYTAGDGIDITNSEISVDTDVIATKSDISSMVTTSMLEDALDDYALKTDIPENVSDLNNDAGYTTQTWVENQNYIKNNDQTYAPIFRGQGVYVGTSSGYPYTWYAQDRIVKYPGFYGDVYEYAFPSKSGTFAMTSDIPSLSGYATETWVQNQGYITGITSSDVVAALGYTPGTSNFSGSYNDLTDTPTIGHGVLTIQVNGVNVKQFSANETAAKTANIMVPTKTSDLTNDSGFITGITSSDVTTALGYTPGTSNFSGNYNDLTNKPTIPDAVSGTNDGTNWTSLTVGNDTYAIPQGGGSTPGMIGEVLYDVPNGQAGVNPITMAHSFADYSYVDIQYRNYDNAYEVKCVRVYDPDGKNVYLDWDVLVSGTVYAKKSIYELSGTTMTVRSGSDMQVWYSNDSKVGTQATAAADYQHQIKITKVIGYKANSSALTTEEWTFTLLDDTTVTKKIVVA